MHPLIDPDQLVRLLDEERLRVLDVRFQLADPAAGRRAYRESHVPGAVYLHLDDDLSAPLARHGGRHPLPDPDVLAETLGRAGVGNDAHVVAIDDGDGMGAGRAWWLLRWLGHDAVQVLDGGMPAYRAAGGPLTTEVPQLPATTFVPSLRPELVADHAWVRDHVDDPDVAIVDVRAPERYRGEVEPIDPVAGHVPGAINRPYLDNLEGGRFRPTGELAEHHRDLADVGTVVFYCGSGVTAANAVLAAEVAGLRTPKLYAGSWSDWISFPDAPVETGPGSDGRRG